MVYTYTPTYYSTLHESITSICKNILPFSFKKRRLPAIAAAEQQLSKQQSDNLKWQQDSFHQILNLMGLCKEGILPESEVSAFRTHLLDTLIASPFDHEQPIILRDKLIFLQELLYTKCISEDEYHSSKRPLLQRLAAQGAEIDARDVVVAAPKESSDEEWSVIDLKDEHCLLNKNSLNSKNKSKHSSAMKQIKGAASAFNLMSSHKHVKIKEDKVLIEPGMDHFVPKMNSSVYGNNELGKSKENPFWDCNLREGEGGNRSILMSETLPPDSMEVQKQSSGDKLRKKPFRTLFQRQGDDHGLDSEGRESKSGKKQWGFDGFKKWKKSDSEDETAPFSLGERSDGETYIREGADTNQIKRKLHSDGSQSAILIDKVLGEKVKKELLRIQAELNATNPNVQFSNDQIESISTRLPIDKADLKKFFPKPWCDRYGDIVLEVVRKEFKNHVEEKENLRDSGREKHNSNQWETFDDNENCHPNLFAKQDHSLPMKQVKFKPLNKNSKNSNNWYENKQRSELACLEDQNPFWNPRHGGSSMLG